MTRRPFAWRLILRNGGGQASASAAIAVCATAAYLHFGHEQLHISTAFTGVLGTVMAIVLGFKNNSAYDRWWEARTLWGAIVNDSRSFARQVEALLPADVSRELLARQVAFAYALRLHLSRREDRALLATWVPAEELPAEGNIPAALMRVQGRRLAALAREAGLAPVAHMEMEATLTRLTAAQGGCERIRNTPFPEQYDDVTHALVWIFCIAFPFTVVGELRYWTIPASIVICFAFQAIDAVGRYLEDPFDGDAEDIPMLALCRTIAQELQPPVESLNQPIP
ncbi:MAG: bestrophin [Cyanobacteria bacterium RYN_339]|nr:bestrophin [Cyanobacteria bacterium RYN_339]